jgi:hypothetical protein
MATFRANCPVFSPEIGGSFDEAPPYMCGFLRDGIRGQNPPRFRIVLCLTQRGME